MLRATFKSLLARKLRLVLSALSVVIGIAFVAGTFMLTDTLRLIQNSVAKIANGPLTCADAGREMLTKGLLNNPH